MPQINTGTVLKYETLANLFSAEFFFLALSNFRLQSVSWLIGKFLVSVQVLKSQLHREINHETMPTHFLL